ncbi:ABC transporter ATP-binding protein [uncultured Amnibacterium sp.]|uniref:ABC transporter ATP-binding protein n=1 Tax=uncultured Amnibacterium sp. TaxID=1631851 RepID=UPI0035CA4D8F
MSENLLRLDGVSVQYGTGVTAVTALSGIDLSVDRGELVAVMGTSGSGKSTLLSVAGGLARPTSGEVIVDGQWLSQLKAKQLAVLRRRSIGFIFQDFNLIPSISAIENVALPLELDGMSRRRARPLAAEALAAVELTDRAQHYPADLSGGQQQRVAIARAVVGGKSLILADEPTGALDSMTGEVVLKMLRARVDAGAGALLVTHDSKHASWADRIVHVRDGRIAGQAQRSSAESLLVRGGQ